MLSVVCLATGLVVRYYDRIRSLVARAYERAARRLERRESLLVMEYLIRIDYDVILELA